VGDQFRLGYVAEGQGRVAIMASTAMEYAFEGAQLTNGAPAVPSVFTGTLVEGIRTGEADRNQDGYVTLDELYDYVYERVHQQSPHQTPCKWEFGLCGKLYLARNPHRRVAPARLPQELLDLLDHPTPTARLAAVEELALIAGSANLARAAAARVALTRFADDDSRRVSVSAQDALRRTAVGLASSTVDFGRVPRGTPEVAAEVAVDGPPLAHACAVSTSSPAVRAELRGGTLRVSWVPRPGRLDEVVTLSGPAGDAPLRVTGELDDDPASAGSRCTRTTVP
jgi:hypothetical protein